MTLARLEMNHANFGSDLECMRYYSECFTQMTRSQIMTYFTMLTHDKANNASLFTLFA